MKNYIIDMIDNHSQSSERFITSNEAEKMTYQNLLKAYDEAEAHGLLEEAVSYYNFIYLKRVRLGGEVYFQQKHKGMLGNRVLGNQFMTREIKENTMNIVQTYQTQSSWGTKELTTMPYGLEISKIMKKGGKTSLGYKDIISTLYVILSTETGFTCYNEFKDRMSAENTMLSKAHVTEILKSFWVETCDYYRQDPVLFNNVKKVVINLQGNLVNSNSNPRLVLSFMEEYIVLASSK